MCVTMATHANYELTKKNGIRPSTNTYCIFICVTKVALQWTPVTSMRMCRCIDHVVCLAGSDCPRRWNSWGPSWQRAIRAFRAAQQSCSSSRVNTTLCWRDTTKSSRKPLARRLSSVRGELFERFPPLSAYPIVFSRPGMYPTDKRCVKLAGPTGSSTFNTLPFRLNLQAAVCAVREHVSAVRCVPGSGWPVLPGRKPAPDLQGAAEEAAGRPPDHCGDPAGPADPRRGATLQFAEPEQ